MLRDLVLRDRRATSAVGCRVEDLEEACGCKLVESSPEPLRIGGGAPVESRGTSWSVAMSGGVSAPPGPGAIAGDDEFRDGIDRLMKRLDKHEEVVRMVVATPGSSTAPATALAARPPAGTSVAQIRNLVEKETVDNRAAVLEHLTRYQDLPTWNLAGTKERIALWYLGRKYKSGRSACLEVKAFIQENELATCQATQEMLLLALVLDRVIRRPGDVIHSGATEIICPRLHRAGARILKRATSQPLEAAAPATRAQVEVEGAFGALRPVRHPRARRGRDVNSRRGRGGPITFGEARALPQAPRQGGGGGGRRRGCVRGGEDRPSPAAIGRHIWVPPGPVFHSRSEVFFLSASVGRAILITEKTAKTGVVVPAFLGPNAMYLSQYLIASRSLDSRAARTRLT